MGEKKKRTKRTKGDEMGKPMRKVDLLKDDEELAPLVGRLRADLAEAAKTLHTGEVRYLVDLYYQVQEFRKRAGNQLDAAGEEPNQLLGFASAMMDALERRIALAMDLYTDSTALGSWAKSLYGVGPVLAAGFLAHIDVERAQTSGAVWRFAGLDPTIKWEKKQKRPYNAQLKTLCWRWADVQWKFHNRDACWYGPKMAERKAYEEARNAAGDNVALAQQELVDRTFRDLDTRRHYEGKCNESKDETKRCGIKKPHLPPGRIHLRALRWGAKLFLSHFWQVGRMQRGLDYHRPYAVEWLGHAHLLEPPNWPMK